MELAKWISFMVLWISTSGQDEYPNPDTQNYQYNYFVRDENTGDVKSHEEKKIGETVTGVYRVGEPTGDLRVVTYTADEGGFRANVKYEEGGSPLSDIRDKEKQISPISGYRFEWLPGNPDDLQAAGKADSDETSEKSQTTEDGSSSEPTSAATSTEGTPVSEATTEDDSSSSSSSEEEAAQKDEPAKPETQLDTESKSDEADSKSDKSESKEESKPEPEDESMSDSETKEDSPEAAASAPQSQEAAPTEPNRVYLPPNLPFYTPPAPDSSDNPTIIYASQNFYNPWQWFGTTARIQREQPPEPPAAHYMTGLGYIIVPPHPEK